MPKFSVIVVAAGKGLRFGDKESKIFAHLDGQPLFLRALQLFCNRDDVCETLLVVAPGEIDRVREKFGPNIGFLGARLVAGGDERSDSVANALAQVADAAEYVAVHDAVRVCVSQVWIDAIFEAATKTGAAVPVVPVNDALKRIASDHTISQSVPRDGLFAAQTPQVFRKDVIVPAYEALKAGELAAKGPFADDAQLVAATGVPVATVPGDARNLKITTKGDLGLAAAIIKTLPQKAIERMGAFDEAKW